MMASELASLKLWFSGALLGILWLRGAFRQALLNARNAECAGPAAREINLYPARKRSAR